MHFSSTYDYNFENRASICPAYRFFLSNEKNLLKSDLILIQGVSVFSVRHVFGLKNALAPSALKSISITSSYTRILDSDFSILKLFV